VAVTTPVIELASWTSARIVSDVLTGWAWVDGKKLAAIANKGREINNNLAIGDLAIGDLAIGDWGKWERNGIFIILVNLGFKLTAIFDSYT
jgi:hypothetical protein